MRYLNESKLDGEFQSIWNELRYVRNDLNTRLAKLEEFLDGVPAFGAAFEGIKHVVDTPTPRSFREGDVVRLLPWDTFNDSHLYEGKECSLVAVNVEKNFEGQWLAKTDLPCLMIRGIMHWPASALELVTAVDAPDLQSELDASRAEVRRLETELAVRDEWLEDAKAENRGLQAKLDALIEKWENQRKTIDFDQCEVHRLTSELDGYRKRIEAGKVVKTNDFLSGGASVHWVQKPSGGPATKTGLVIDVAEIVPEVPANNRRKGERRELQAKGTLDVNGERVFYRVDEQSHPCKRYKDSRCPSHPRRSSDRREAGRKA